MTDAALAKKRRAPADRLHRNGLSPRRARRPLQPRREPVAALAQHASSTGKSTSSMVFWPASDLPRAFTASIAAANASAICSRRHLVGERLAERQEQGAVERTGRAAHFHHQRRADALQRLRQSSWRRARQQSASTASKPRSYWCRDRRRRSRGRDRSIRRHWR